MLTPEERAERMALIKQMEEDVRTKSLEELQEIYGGNDSTKLTEQQKNILKHKERLLLNENNYASDLFLKLAKEMNEKNRKYITDEDFGYNTHGVEVTSKEFNFIFQVISAYFTKVMNKDENEDVEVNLNIEEIFISFQQPFIPTMPSISYLIKNNHDKEELIEPFITMEDMFVKLKEVLPPKGQWTKNELY